MSNLIHRFKALKSGEQFLVLIIGYFGVNVICGLLLLLVNRGILPSLNFSINEVGGSAMAYLFQVLNLVLCMSILVLLYKNYGLKTKSRIGLLLLMIVQFSFVVNTWIRFAQSSSPALSLLLIYVMAAFFVVNAVGIILFISGSPVERKLKNVVMLSPFIPLIVSLLLSVIYRIDLRMQQYLYPDVISLIANLLVFAWVYRLARRSMTVSDR